jgi:hypothetical protein
MHADGEEGMRFCIRRKRIMQRWPETTAKGAEFAMPTAKPGTVPTAGDLLLVQQQILCSCSHPHGDWRPIHLSVRRRTAVAGFAIPVPGHPEKPCKAPVGAAHGRSTEFPFRFDRPAADTAGRTRHVVVSRPLCPPAIRL